MRDGTAWLALGQRVPDVERSTEALHRRLNPALLLAHHTDYARSGRQSHAAK